ncbi:winged helix family transcriptional regulator [Amycolatopsis sp. WAC 04182]|uniref:winged helix-turn-helix domain-containing protein n=1 Tax=Amycolatopsis sp. WAC 04182 TaxID=2203198 RepID=UPI000F795DDC|nr:winged helix-turn-helix domain-containing protein [Amycolatopsis sp. WAC 04182]RSN65916.1 winged helix family transcriptional regulator [Amycolatopsis sp. WAC 04182]
MTQSVAVRVDQPVELTLELRVSTDPEHAAAIAARLVESFEDTVRVTLTARTVPADSGQVIELAGRRRRSGETAPPLRIEPDSRRVLLRGEVLEFTRLEFDLLLFLSRNPDRVFDRLTLMAQVWGLSGGNGRTVDVHVRKIRGKLEPVLTPIATVRGVGYRFDGAGQVLIAD